MAFSSLVSLAIVFATAATLHAHGITDIATSAQAAEALRPIAGEFAFALFAAGIIGTGLLAVPVLAVALRARLHAPVQIRVVLNAITGGVDVQTGVERP